MRLQPPREKVYIYGKHALEEALTSTPHVIRKVFLSRETTMSEPELVKLLAKHKVPVETMKGPRDAGRMVGDETAHQGVIAVADPSALLVDFKSFISNLKSTERTMLVLLDELTDPHNVGAIIRSAAAFGAAGVLMPSHNQAPITGAVVKASAGMVFRIPIVAIGNVNSAVDALKDAWFKTYALAANGARNVAEEKFDAPALFIVGNEATGIRQKTFERADVTLRIPIDPKCESLNASVSAAVVLYQWSVARSQWPIANSQ
jgi:23S rRNA (guanosine2251-2'-O)-methyltransferase